MHASLLSPEWLLDLPTSRKTVRLFHGSKGDTSDMSYDNQNNAFTGMFEERGIIITKRCHAFRHGGAQALDEMG